MLFFIAFIYGRSHVFVCVLVGFLFFVREGLINGFLEGLESGEGRESIWKVGNNFFYGDGSKCVCVLGGRWGLLAIVV